MLVMWILCVAHRRAVLQHGMVQGRPSLADGGGGQRDIASWATVGIPRVLVELFFVGCAFLYATLPPKYSTLAPAPILSHPPPPVDQTKIYSPKQSPPPCPPSAGNMKRTTGDTAGKVTVSDSNLSSKVQRQAYSGPILALVLAPEGVLPGAGTSRAYPLSSNNASSPTSAGSAAPANDKKKHGIVVTLGDDSVIPPPQSAGIGNPLIGGGGAAAGGSAANLGGGGGAGGGGGNGRSPCVLKFWAGADMTVCIRTVDVAAQMRDGQQQRWATGGRGGAGEGGGMGQGMGVPRLTAFAVMPDASQVRRWNHL